jgi:hypothetical protein
MDAGRRCEENFGVPNMKREVCVVEGRKVKRKAPKRRKNRTRRKRERLNMAVRGGKMEKEGQHSKGGTMACG